MNSCQLGRRLGVVAGGAAIIAMGAFTAGCSTSQKEAPSTTTTTTTTITTTEVPPPPPPSPSEKGLNPTGGNLVHAARRRATRPSRGARSASRDQRSSLNALRSWASPGAAAARCCLRHLLRMKR